MPKISRTWTISANNRIAYVSLNDLIAHYLFGIKAFLKANGYTVAGSCDGTTGAMDGVDRWSTFSNATTRGANASSAQSWIVLRDGNGVHILLSYLGATDDICLMAFSPGALYVVAGTTTFKPTAADETNFTAAAGLSMLNNTTSGDRVWHGYVDATRKLCRFVPTRQNVAIGLLWGVELVRSTVRSPALFSPPVWGFAMTASGNNVINNTAIGAARPTMSSVAAATLKSCVFGMEFLSNSATTYGAIQPELQGGPSAGYPALAVEIG